MKKYLTCEIDQKDFDQNSASQAACKCDTSIARATGCAFPRQGTLVKDAGP